MTSDRPQVVVQLSDFHVGADWGGGEPVALLTAVVEAVLALNADIAGVLVSGDLADHAADDEYELVQRLLAPIEAPLYVLPGNHDDRAALRRSFGLPGAAAEPVQYAVDGGPLRLVIVDSTRPGEDGGELDAPRLEWLDETLRAAPEAPTLVALHHTPLRTGMPAVDEWGLSDEDLRALGAVVARHPQIVRIVGGHIHQSIAGTLGGRPVLAAPSTYVPSRLRFGPSEIDMGPGPSGFAVHLMLDGVLVSHVRVVVPGEA